MGAAESNPVRNMDKRTCRREHKESFMKGIQYFRRNGIRSLIPSAIDTDDTTISKNRDLRVCVRKRPIFQHEVDDGEFDVATCVKQKTIIIHDARMRVDMRNMFINNNIFSFDYVFNESSQNEDVFIEAALPLVSNAVNSGYATCLVYGQTGSGKTFTMRYIYERAAKDIFEKDQISR